MESNFFIHNPAQIKGELFDLYLSAGWYRYGNKIFTIDFFEDNGQRFQVYWLRYNIQKMSWTETSKKIFKKNKRFSYQIIPFRNTEELEALHTLYFHQIDFITSPTIEALLEDVSGKVFDSMLIEIREENKLIAAGIFDMGTNCIAGIKNIFHPDYKQYSLGKYLMLLKCQYCSQQNINWYYPGYFAPGYKKFDYKLAIAPEATEICLTENRQWITYHDFILMGC